MPYTNGFNKRFLGDSNPNRLRHVHDLENEKANCAIKGLMWAGHPVGFDTKEAAFKAGYIPCFQCMPYEKGAS